MACVIFHEKCASFSLAMESVILQKAQLGEEKIFLCARFHICVLRLRRVRSNIMLVP